MMRDAGHKKAIQKYYSHRAKDYDKQKSRTWKSERGFNDRVVDIITDITEGSTEKSILEVCVGSGRISSLLLKKHKSYLVGLDLSKEMLKLAKARMATSKDDVDLVLGDAEYLPFTNEAFDILVCVSAMHYFTKPEHSLVEFRQVLREKGVFVYGDLSLHKSD